MPGLWSCPGKSCLLYSGEKRNEPHRERKLLALGVKKSVGDARVTACSCLAVWSKVNDGEVVAVGTWDIICKSCQKTFTYALIDDSLENFYFPAKPEMPHNSMLKSSHTAVLRLRTFAMSLSITSHDVLSLFNIERKSGASLFRPELWDAPSVGPKSVVRRQRAQLHRGLVGVGHPSALTEQEDAPMRAYFSLVNRVPEKIRPEAARGNTQVAEARIGYSLYSVCVPGARGSG